MAVRPMASPWVSMLKCSNDLDDFRTLIREILNHKFVDLATWLAMALMESAPVWSRRVCDMTDLGISTGRLRKMVVLLVG